MQEAYAEDILSQLEEDQRYALCFGGTTEGRLLTLANIALIYSALTEYGAQLIDERDNLIISYGALRPKEIEQLLQSSQIYAVIDATHPFAQSISQSIYSACKAANKPLARFYRPRNAYHTENNKEHYADSLDEALKLLENEFSASKVFASTGVQSLTTLSAFSGAQNMRARILPSEMSRKLAKDASFSESQLIYAQGPFSVQDNLRDFEGSDVLLSKESGKRGGFEEKLEAARILGMDIIIIIRPPELEYENAFTKVNQILAWLKEL